MKHFLERCAAVAIGSVARPFPRRIRLAMGRAAGELVFRLDRRHRRVTIDNVTLAYGDELDEASRVAIARGAFRHFGAMLFELLTLGRPAREDVESLVSFEGAERYERARDRGKGVVLITAHFGNWELHGLAHAYRFGPMHVVAREQENSYLNQRLASLRGIAGNEVIYKNRALRQTRALMKKGETVAFVIDQNVHLQDAIFVDFFGRKAATTPVAAWFALKAGAALVPAFSIPTEDGRYRLIYEEPVDAEPYRELSQEDALLALTQELTDVQERYIREWPTLWMWMHRRFRTRPPGEAGEGEAAPSESLVDTAAAAEL